MANVRNASPQGLAQTRFDFHDQRLPELLFRYRARNWPETLSVDEAQRWESFRRHRLQVADGGGSITLVEHHEQIALLRGEREGDAAASGYWMQWMQWMNGVRSWSKLSLQGDHYGYTFVLISCLWLLANTETGKGFPSQ